MSRGPGTIQKKILLLLLGGLTLGMTRSPKQYFRVARSIGRAWKDINRRDLERAINGLYKSHLVETRYHQDHGLTLVLSKEGKHVAHTFKIDEMSLAIPRKWDGKWRMVLFDIPEKLRRYRDSFRIKLQGMGFLELQKSVFIHPAICYKEVEFLVEFYNVRKYVRTVEASAIDNELDLKRHYGLK